MKMKILKGKVENCLNEFSSDFEKQSEGCFGKV